MKKISLVSVFITLCFTSFSQVLQRDNIYGRESKIGVFDSVLRVPLGLERTRVISGFDTGQLRYNKSDSSIYVHTGTGWKRLGDSTGGAGSGGTVIDFISGNLSPLFSTSVSTSTLTPTQSFSLTNVAPYKIFGRASGTGAPSYLSSLDSNWIPSLHSQTYYDVRYLHGGGTELDPHRVTSVGWSGNDSVHVLTISLADGSNFNAPVFDRGSGAGGTSYTETDPIVGAINGLIKANGSGTISAATAGTDYEAGLGNPAADGYVLSSTAAGVRSWIASTAPGLQDVLNTNNNLNINNSINVNATRSFTINQGGTYGGYYQDDNLTAISSTTSGSFLDYTQINLTPLAGMVLAAGATGQTDNQILFENSGTTFRKSDGIGGYTSDVIVKAKFPVYADEAAATTGGLATGTIYQTSTGALRIKL